MYKLGVLFMDDPCCLGIFCGGDVISGRAETWQEGITPIDNKIDLHQYQRNGGSIKLNIKINI